MPVHSTPPSPRQLGQLALLLACLSLTTVPAAAQLSPQMRGGIAGALPVPPYSNGERAVAVQRLLNLQTPPILDAPISLTPNAPYAADGSRLSFWKPSFVLGTAAGGEAGINFWGIYDEGHVNIAFTPISAKRYVVDCRLISSGSVTYKIYSGDGIEPRKQSEMPLIDNHLVLVVAGTAEGQPLSMELWPTPTTETMGFLGCELSLIE